MTVDFPPQGGSYRTVFFDQLRETVASVFVRKILYRPLRDLWLPLSAPEGLVASAFRRKIHYRRPMTAHTPGIIAAAMQILMMSAGRNG